MAEKNDDATEQLFINDGLSLSSELSENPDKREIADNLRQLYSQVDLLTDSFVQHCGRQGKNVDCKMGCSWCCYQPVFALTHEMLVLVEYIRDNFTEDVIDRIMKLASDKIELTRILPSNELLKTNAPCPLLKNGVCMVYPVRPMACRIYLSSDVKSCQEKYDRPAGPDVKPALFGFMLDAGRNMNYGYVFGLMKRNLISREAPLEWLLHKFLNDANAFDKWLNGEILNESFDFEG